METGPMVDSITSEMFEPCRVLLIVVAFKKVPSITAGFCYTSEMLIFSGGQFLSVCYMSVLKNVREGRVSVVTSIVSAVPPLEWQDSMAR